MIGDSKPFRVNSWDNHVTETHGEVWYDGVDRYIVYINGERTDSYPVFLSFGYSKAHLLAVGEACKLAYKKVMGKDWADEMRVYPRR